MAPEYMNKMIKKISKQSLKEEKAKEKAKKLEQKQIEMVKKDPHSIKNMKNPSQLVRNYAISSFRSKYER